MTDGVRKPVPPTPYSTGGGGTVLEHQYGAVLLSHLLTGDPVPELGADVVPQSVHLQANAESPVDDFVVAGRTPDDGERRVSVGVRRAPKLTSKDEESVGLLATFIRAVAEDWTAIDEGRWVLALAVASANPAVVQLRALSVIAKSCRTEAQFRTKVQRPGETNKGVRDRLAHVDKLMNGALAAAGVELTAFPPDELTWRVLSVLRVRELRLQDGDDTDRTHAVGRLRGVVPDAIVASADSLFSRLAEQVGQYAPTGALVTESSLRRDLAGTPLGRSSSYPQAWRFLDGISDRLYDRIRLILTDGRTQLALERSEVREALSKAMAATAANIGALAVVGNPDVGKSALALQAAQQVKSAGWAVTTLSLRDLPDSVSDLESYLGGSLDEVLGATAVGAGRLLVLDGCESVLEGRHQLLVDVATAAFRAGFGVVSVTRTDGAQNTKQALRDALTAATLPEQVTEYEVASLEPGEVGQVAAAFPALTRLAAEPRMSWILSRPGLVDLLLRAGATFGSGGLETESDVLEAVWRSWVRRDESTRPGGSTPDDRERAMLWLARRQLGSPQTGDAPSSLALASLRSDGLLLVPGVTSAWNPGDAFASDLIRDFAVAVELSTAGFNILADTDGSRWALRAARLACQVRLSATDQVRERLRQLRALLDSVAEKHGQRWGELPWEAVLTLGSPRDALTALWPDLLADDKAGLRTLIRLALQRYARGGIGDPLVLEPLVTLLYCDGADLGPDQGYGRDDLGKQIRKLVLAFLRGLIMANAPQHPARQQVRDTVMSKAPLAHDEFAVEALASLGPDLNEDVRAFLLGLAADSGHDLAPAVENLGPVLALSRNQPELLLALTEAYYIDTDHAGFGHSFDGGIRPHRPGGGFGQPMAASYYGPFFHLLSARPRETLAVINRMLDHAATIEATPRDYGYPVQLEQVEAEPAGLDLNLLGTGDRRYVGDQRVWCWYRGSSAGPSPCVSALLAVERYADHLVDKLGLPLAGVAAALLHDCGNLAMPALAVGLLVRHLETAEDLLDRWLVYPELWQLENARASTEGFMHVQGQDPADLAGRSRRNYSFNDVASELTLRAMLAQDSARLAALGEVGDELQRRTNVDVDESATERREVVEIRSSLFRPENYRAFQTEAGLVMQYEHPADVAEAIAPKLAELAHGNEALRLQGTYASTDGTPVPIETLSADIALARQLAADPPIYGPLHAADPIVAVAAAAILATAEGRAELSSDDVSWASDTVAEAARQPYIDAMTFESTVYPMGADRSAAAVLPALLLPAFDNIPLNQQKTVAGLTCSATSRYGEVRMAFAAGTHRVWNSPCQLADEEGPCRHEVLWAVVLEGLTDCRLGKWDHSLQARPSEPLQGPYDQALLDADTDSLMLNRLTAPLVATAAAARSHSCIAEAAGRLLDALVQTHSRVADHWATKGYSEYSDRQRQAVAQALVETSVSGKPEPLASYLQFLIPNVSALAMFLQDLGRVFTYDADLRRSLLEQWRMIMSIVLDAVDDGAALTGTRHHSDRATSAILPVPQVDPFDSDMGTSLDTARSNWIDPDTIADLVARWLPSAQRDPISVDAVVQLARCARPAWQATTGLRWVEEVVNGSYNVVAERCYYLLSWLEDVRAFNLASDDQARWRRIVDGLAANGESRAVSLQQAEE